MPNYRRNKDISRIDPRAKNGSRGATGNAHVWVEGADGIGKNGGACKKVPTPRGKKERRGF